MNNRIYDAIIVGARAAGASTAMLLARRGYRVLLVDRARFPSDIPHGHMIHKDGPRRLRDWGLLDRLIEAGTPPVDTVTIDCGDFPLTARHMAIDGVAWGYGPRRRVIDTMLLEAAVLAGAEFRDGFAVDDLTFDDGRVSGIRGRAGGASVTERAVITIGADGRHSRVARAVAAPVRDEQPTLLCYYFSYWSGVAAEGMEIYHVKDQACFAHPTTDGLLAVFMGWAIARFPEVRSDVERSFMMAADRFPGLADRLRSGRREERFYGAADLPNVRRTPFGPGWALVGDAGFHKDPYMALGMSDALRDAELLASAVDRGLSGTRPLPEALAEYERRRDEASAADYQENLAMARLEPAPAEVLGIRAALRGDDEQTRRFLMARMGMVPPETFFNPENLTRLAGRGHSRIG